MEFSLDHLQRIFNRKPDAPQLMSDLLAFEVSHARDKLIRFLATNKGSPFIGETMQLYNKLEQENQIRVLASAELEDVLEDWDELPPGKEREAVLPRMQDVMWRELALQRIRNGEGIDDLDSGRDLILSPIGDMTAVKKNGSWITQHAMTICDSIALDFDSPLAKRVEPESGTLSEPRLELSDKERLALQEKLILTLSNIDKAEPMYGLMIRIFVRRIIIRKSVEPDEELGVTKHVKIGSEFRPRQPGSIRLLNAHLPQKSIASCMEAMLHETVHAAIAAYEVQGKFTNSAVAFRPISPWTGNPIPNHSLAHAIFVYYVCHQLFQSCLLKVDELENVDKETVGRRLSFFGAGFLINRQLTDCFFLDESLKPEVKVMIDQMQDAIRAIYVHDACLEIVN